MFRFIKLLLISLCFVSILSFAEDEPKSVIVSGTGGTREIALNNAFRHAVEQAVGMMVSSESYVKNLKDIQDKIFLVSNGFIEQYNVLTEDHDTTGYAVTISAVVRQKQLKTAMSSTTNTVMSLDGGALFANQMLKEDKIIAYSEEITRFLDDLISNGFEYKYNAPELNKVEGKTGAYYLFLPNFEVYLKKEWLSSLSKYRENLKTQQLFADALELLTINDDSIQYIIGFRFEAQDDEGNVIVGLDGGEGTHYHENYVGNAGVGVSISKVLGLYYYSNFRYPNISDVQRLVVHRDLASNVGYRSDHVFFGPITSDSAAKVKKIVIRAVKVKDYGGKLPLYKGDGVFE